MTSLCGLQRCNHGKFKVHSGLLGDKLLLKLGDKRPPRAEVPDTCITSRGAHALEEGQCLQRALGVWEELVAEGLTGGCDMTEHGTPG